jgi:hypothetical protein
MARTRPATDWKIAIFADFIDPHRRLACCRPFYPGEGSTVLCSVYIRYARVTWMLYGPASRPPRPRPCVARSVGASFDETSSASNRNRNKQIVKHMKQHQVGWVVCMWLQTDS